MEIMSRDSGAEVSEDDCEEGLVCEGARLVEMIISVIRKTCSILLLAHNTDVKNGELQEYIKLRYR